MSNSLSFDREQMSESLKARLKKCRSYCSPITNSSSPTAGLSSPSSNLGSGRKITVSSNSRAYSAFKSPLVRGTTDKQFSQTPKTIPRQQNHDGCNLHSADESTRRTLAKEFCSSKFGEQTQPASITPENDTDLYHFGKGLKRKLEETPDECFDERDESVDEKQSSTDHMTLIEARQRMKHLIKEIAEKEEKIRKLNMVKHYRAKNNLQTLDELIMKWRTVSQQALLRLHDLTQQPQPTLTQLINHLNIDHSLIGYCVDDESFT